MLENLTLSSFHENVKKLLVGYLSKHLGVEGTAKRTPNVEWGVSLDTHTFTYLNF